MPHKHKRQRNHDVEDNYDLPPTAKARPLKTGKHSDSVFTEDTKSKSARRKEGKAGKADPNSSGSYGKDDTPRAFQRLLQYQRTGRGVSGGLDNGDEQRGKKRKRHEAQAGTSTTNEPASIPGETPLVQTLDMQQPQQQAASEMKIQPNERFTDFIARVDQALPLAGISTKGKKVAGIKERRTKHDKRLRKLQDGWRAEEAKIREREEEEREAAEDEWEERLAGLDREGRAVAMAVRRVQSGARDGSGSGGKNKGKKASKKKRPGGGSGEIGTEAQDDDDDEDPWAVLNERREAPKGVFDVVQAPPTFKKLPREVFKGGDVPRNAGSLRKREELGQTRADIIKNYRAMMAQMRA